MERDLQVPDGWRLARLGDVADVNRDQWDPSEGSPILYLDLTAVVAPGRLSPPTRVAARDAPSRARRRVHSGDVLVSTVRPNLRGFARAQEAPCNLVASTGFAVLTPTSEVEGSMVYHHVMTPAFARYLDANTTGQAYPAVRPADVAWYLFALPPFSEQRAIAGVLDAIDEAIERTEAVIAATERLRDSLLHELLTRGVPGWHSEWKEVAGVGTAPACWEVVRLGEVATVIMGYSPPGKDCNRSGHGVPLLNGPTEFSRDHPVPGQWTRAPRKLACRGDLLFCVRGATAGRMNWANRDYAIGRGVAALRHNTGAQYQNYLSALIEHRLPRLLHTVTGSTFPNLSYEHISNLRILDPPLSEQLAVGSTIEAIDDAIRSGREERDRLQAMKDSAADALLTGRLRITTREGTHV